MASRRSISFRKRKEVGEIYTFPIGVDQATLQIRNSAVMVEYQDDGEALIIAGNIPGMSGYYDNYPDVEGEDKQKRYEFSHKLLEEAMGFLEGYNPETSFSKSNQGNRSLNDIYVTADESERDAIVMKMWQLLNHMKERYIEFLENQEDEQHLDYPRLTDEVLEVSKDINLS